MIFKKKHLMTTVFASTVLITTLTATQNASAYSVDCAILLCMAGGFPSNNVCNLAYATVVRRITPFPIEPPLQIWLCPLGLANNIDFKSPYGNLKYELQSANFEWKKEYPQSRSNAEIVNSISSQLSKVIGTKQVALLDGSDSQEISRFVQTIKVWDVRGYEHYYKDSDEECYETPFVNLGTYDSQGNFTWAKTASKNTPEFVIPNKKCQRNRFSIPPVRAVGLEWDDFENKHGQEVINY